MKKSLKKKFLIELKDTLIVSAVCDRLNISRQTLYRWKKEDQKFAKEFERVQNEGNDIVTDVAKSNLINRIKCDDERANFFWLNKMSKEFRNEKEIIKNKDIKNKIPRNLPVEEIIKIAENNIIREVLTGSISLSQYYLSHNKDKYNSPTVYRLNREVEKEAKKENFKVDIEESRRALRNIMAGLESSTNKQSQDPISIEEKILDKIKNEEEDHFEILTEKNNKEDDKIIKRMNKEKEKLF